MNDIMFEQWEKDMERRAKIYARKLMFKAPRTSKAEKEELREIYKSTTKDGSILYECKTEKQAEKYRKFLMHHLPPEYAATTIGNSVNTYLERQNEKTKRVSDETTHTEGNSGSQETDQTG